MIAQTHHPRHARSRPVRGATCAAVARADDGWAVRLRRRVRPRDAGPGFGDGCAPASAYSGLRPSPGCSGAQIEHRDSLGSVSTIRPGQVNLMTAGRGIVHSERSPDTERGGGELFGMQTWLALPDGEEECAPAFEAVDDLPIVEDGGARATVIMGSLWGRRAPVTTHAETIYAEITLEPGGAIPIDSEADERALMLVSGAATVDGEPLDRFALHVLEPGRAMTLRSSSGVRAMLLGGEAFRHQATCLVELRPFGSRPDRAGQGRLARRPLPTCPRRRRTHPPARRGTQDGELSMSLNDKTVWITGASSGIGAALAREAAARGRIAGAVRPRRGALGRGRRRLRHPRRGRTVRCARRERDARCGRAGRRARHVRRQCRHLAAQPRGADRDARLSRHHRDRPSRADRACTGVAARHGRAGPRRESRAGWSSSARSPARWACRCAPPIAPPSTA